MSASRFGVRVRLSNAELPDVTVYVECLERLVIGERIVALRVTNPFVLRSVTPAPDDLAGRKVTGARRLGKRVVLELDDGFPEKVTAFHDGMAVHGRYGKLCPDRGDPVQRIRYAESECNYCATCQTGGRLLADRSLSRLLKADWPKRIEDLEDR